MRSARFITLFIFALLSPFFVLAQTTTTAEQPQSDLEIQLNQLMNERNGLIPTPEAIRSNALRDNLKVTTIPKNPAPGESVRVTIESFLSDLNKATISWSLNGNVVERGAGKTTFSFKNGASGQTTRLVISITTNEGERFTKEIVMNPVGVTILWEADTYTPPFYKGKALMAPQARIRAIAIPDNVGTRNALDAGNLVYVWKKDGSAIPEASGYGKNSFSFLGPKPYGKASVSVQVSSVNDTLKSELRLDEIPLNNPFILFYEDHPLLGAWYNRSLGSDLTLAKKEFSISAEPYFFSNETSEISTISYNWSLNGKTVTNPGRGITLRNETGEQGDSAITLAMRGLKQTFQSASRPIMVHFMSEESSSPTF
ncbi:MAG: hypothetical protein A2937_00340 [Candidatus Yonathbacteria bacterium RIFCSPLOWO2_01_FULL_47_33b]|uniref:Ig-like domain-containing protein n=1 Tax=Candidatus Yonathbacteria bacterium RIFCSPLOWO2_01_FULL_47_33b TaxID=1802727 RepID=A0A1G2SGQ2_9BACT|nr:MAG: hypothetical protein A2937_00340 [Candidatus Yonathbacteria bacterium RIFCSPLOWO2_01_FULL_47_33b]